MAKYEYKVKGVDYVVEIQDIEGNIANVTVNGIPFEVEMKQPVKSSKQNQNLLKNWNLQQNLRLQQSWQKCCFVHHLTSLSAYYS